MEFVKVRTNKEGVTGTSKSAPNGRRKIHCQAVFTHEGEEFILSGQAWSKTPIVDK